MHNISHKHCSYIIKKMIEKAIQNSGLKFLITWRHLYGENYISIKDNKIKPSSPDALHNYIQTKEMSHTNGPIL